LVFHTAELAALDLKESFVAAANAGNKQKYVREFRGDDGAEEQVVFCAGFGLAVYPCKGNIAGPF
jgi:hypothetical protein